MIYHKLSYSYLRKYWLSQSHKSPPHIWRHYTPIKEHIVVITRSVYYTHLIPCRGNADKPLLNILLQCNSILCFVQNLKWTDKNRSAQTKG